MAIQRPQENKELRAILGRFGMLLMSESMEFVTLIAARYTSLRATT